ILHDDDWWGVSHLATALTQLNVHPDSVAYWASCYLVYGESSWMECWNMTGWMASRFAPLTEVAKLDIKQAALACLPWTPAHYSSLVAKRNTFLECFNSVIETKTPYDNDRLMFLEFAKRGAVLLNLVPEVFNRRHTLQNSRAQEMENANEHVQATTEAIL